MTSGIAPALAALSPVARLAVFVLSAGLISSHAPARAADVAFSDQESHASERAGPARPVQPQRYRHCPLYTSTYV